MSGPAWGMAMDNRGGELRGGDANNATRQVIRRATPRRTSRLRAVPRSWASNGRRNEPIRSLPLLKAEPRVEAGLGGMQSR
mmetsp:Transcript_16699/g.31674  ORF Transcript_16699/g.31674 Transcript_16699/m.31674 type:complete len:81 (+) Transcript_16699:1659-1901(+)